MYRPAGATLVVVGAVTRSSLVPSLERAFGDWTGGPATHAEREPADHRQRRVVTFVDRPGAPQSELRIGHIGPPRDSPDYFALVVLNTVLGGAFTSRLNQRLREEKGFTYGARSGFAFRSGPGPFTVSTAVGAEATAEAVADVVEVIAKLRRELVSEAERSRATNYLALGLPRRIETGSSLAQRLTEIELYELEHDYFDRYAQRVRNVRADDMLAAARRHLDPDRLVIAIAGDRARTANRLAELGFAHIEVAEDLS